jgi:exopolyphosphatase/guanosine-5'-triphosphate,3'-diphosphate pyrophosphatase
MSNDTKLSPSGILSTLEALQQYRQLLQVHDVQQVKAVATAAVRDCNSPSVFLSAAEQVLGHPVQLLSGDHYMCH